MGLTRHATGRSALPAPSRAFPKRRGLHACDPFQYAEHIAVSRHGASHAVLPLYVLDAKGAVVADDINKARIEPELIELILNGVG
jgi:hypothetical protein